MDHDVGRQLRPWSTVGPLVLPDGLDELAEVAWCVDGDGGHIWTGTAWERFTGTSAQDNQALGWLSCVEVEDRPALLAALLPDGPSQPLDLRLRHAGDGAGRWMRARVVRLRGGADGRFIYACLATDIDELRRPRESQAGALAALQHRMRTTFAVILSIVRRTARFQATQPDATIDGFASSLEGRIAAMARIQANVVRAPTAGLDLAQLVADELAAHAAHEGPSVSIAGPPLRLRPRTAELLALALHELANNAVRHGALGGRTGRVDVAWAVDGGMFAFEWRESGLGQPLPLAGPGGYGRMMLEKAMQFELGTAAHLDFKPDGLRMDLRLPVSGIVQGGP